MSFVQWYSSNIKGDDWKLYNAGSEWQDDFGNLPDFYSTYYRNYDAALGRFISVDPKVEASENMMAYQYAENDPLMFNDPLGDLSITSFPNYRVGPGSGNYWADGIGMSDWSAEGGSEMYKTAIEAGMRSFGGTLYNTNRDGSRSPLIYNNTNGQFGYFTFSGESALEKWSNVQMIGGDMYAAYSSGVHGEWTKMGVGSSATNSQGGLQDVLGNINSGVGGFGVGVSAQNELFDFAVRNNYKSANAWSEFRNLRITQQSFRIGNTLGKTGAKFLEVTKGLGAVAAVAVTAITVTRAGMYYYGGGTDASVAIKAGLDIVMTGVGFLGPVGFGISATYFILDTATGGFGGYGAIK